MEYKTPKIPQTKKILGQKIILIFYNKEGTKIILKNFNLFVFCLETKSQFL